MGDQLLKARQKLKRRPLVGVTVNTFDCVFIDIVANFDVDVIWIEMEHSSTSMREAEMLCRIINANGMLSLIRLPSGDRDVALKAAETGADMLMIPMINEPAELERFVSHTRYAPHGDRGFYKPSRAMNYGLGSSIADLRRQANQDLMLWGQVETLSALARLPELCQVDGIDGLFMGPGDLSSAYGVPGETGDARVIEAVARGIATSQHFGRAAGTVSRPNDALQWCDQAVDLLVVGGNVDFYVNAATSMKSQLDVALAGSTRPACSDNAPDRSRVDSPHPRIAQHDRESIERTAPQS